MTQGNSVNVKLTNSQLNKLKSATKTETGIALRSKSNLIGNSNDEVAFSYKLLLTNTQAANLRKAHVNNLPANIKLSKTQLSKTVQASGFLGRILGSLLKIGIQ